MTRNCAAADLQRPTTELANSCLKPEHLYSSLAKPYNQGLSFTITMA